MIIVSQYKVANINYNNIEAIYMLKKDDKIEINVRGNYDYTIGKYETEERAKEVLQEIIDKYKEYATIQNRVGSISDVEILPKVYEMPTK